MLQDISENLHLKLWDISPKSKKRDIVSRKTRDLLTKGLTSELYLLAYIEPNNIRKLAQKLQNTSGHPTNYSKASPAIHDLTVAKYLKHKEQDKKFHVNVLKLCDELAAILNEKNISLGEREKGFLLKLLEEKEFFKLISKDIVKKIQNQEKGKHGISALDVFCEKIGSLAAMTMLYIAMNKENDSVFTDPDLPFEEKIEIFNELKENWKDFQLKFDKEFEKIRKTIPESPMIDELIVVFKNMPSMFFVFLIPKETLEKLGNLWQGHEGVNLSLQAFSLASKNQK